MGSGLVVFAGLLQQFSSQVANLTNIANSVQQSLSGARRVFEILDTPIAIESRRMPVRLIQVADAVSDQNRCKSGARTASAASAAPTA